MAHIAKVTLTIYQEYAKKLINSDQALLLHPGTPCQGSEDQQKRKEPPHYDAPAEIEPCKAEARINSGESM